MPTIEELKANQQFLSDYEGKKILTTNKQGSGEGGTVYQVQGGQLIANPFDPTVPNQNFDALFNPETGLKPVNVQGGSYATAEAFKYFNMPAPTVTPPTGQEAALKAQGQSGLNAQFNQPIGATPAFNVAAPTQNTAPIQEPVVRAEYLGGGGVDPAVFVGTQAQVEQQARDAGINPANLQYSTGGRIAPQNAISGSTQGSSAQATLTSPDGSQKTVVNVGSKKASDLLSSGWTLGAGGVQTVDAISIDTLEQEKPVNLPAPETGISNPAAVTDAANQAVKSIEEYKKIIAGEETPLSKEVGSLTDEVSGLLEQTKGQAEALKTEQEARGVNTLQQSLTNIQNELLTKTAAYNKLYAEIQGKPITMSSIIGQEAQARAVAQADLGFLMAQATALQNNITFAKQQAQESVDAKYAPVFEEIRIKSAQLELIQPELTKEEKTYADALKLYYQDRQQAITDAKAEDKSIQDIMLKAIDAGIKDSNILTQIQKSGSVENALAIYGANKPETTAELDTQIVTANGRSLLVNKQTGETIRDLGAAYKSTDTPTTNNFKLIENQLLQQVGADGFVSPDDYALAKQDWVAAGGAPAEFDRKFKDRRNPANPYYEVTGQKEDLFSTY